MREIKFRAWEKSYKRMSKVTEIKWKEEHLYHQIFTQAIVNNKRIDDSYTYDFSGVSNGIVLMQFTGLKDKNGKEIYDGDIVEFTRFAGNPTTGTYKLTDMCIVKWVNEKCSFRLCYKTQKQKMLEGYEYEIIGNIYENKELLQN